MRFSTLTLERRTSDGGFSQPGRDFLDFIIDGKSLRELLGEAERVGVLGRWNAANEHKAARQLTLQSESELPSGRVPLFVCPMCGHVDCGALAVRIGTTDDAFVWRDFVCEVSYCVDPDDDGVQQRYYVGPYYFEKDSYLRIFSTWTDYVAV